VEAESEPKHGTITPNQKTYMGTFKFLGDNAIEGVRFAGCICGSHLNPNDNNVLKLSNIV